MECVSDKRTCPFEYDANIGGGSYWAGQAARPLFRLRKKHTYFFVSLYFVILLCSTFVLQRASSVNRYVLATCPSII